MAAGLMMVLGLLSAPGLVSADSYSYALKWGTPGSGNSQFDVPYDNDTDSAGNIYVVDFTNKRIQKFSAAGVYISQFSTIGNGHTGNPLGIAVDHSGNAYVTSNDHYVRKFNSSGVYQSEFGGWGTSDTTFSYPVGIDLSPDDSYLYVMDCQNSYVKKFSTDPGYAFDRKFGGGGQLYQSGWLTVDSAGYVFVADSNWYNPSPGHLSNDRIQKFNEYGTYQSGWGYSGSGPGQFSYAFGITADQGGNVFVTDSGNNRVQKFTNNGIFLGQFGSPGTNDGQFQQPTGVSVGLAGQVYVTDTGSNRVQVFSDSASLWSFTPVPTASSGPVDMTTNLSTGAPWFTEINSNKIGKVNLSGAGDTITEYSIPTGNSFPQGISSDATGDIWFAESGSAANKIARVTNAGVFTEWAIPTGAAGASDTIPVTGGNVWFSESSLNKIGRLVPGTGVITEFGALPGGYSGPGKICEQTGAGKVWFSAIKGTDQAVLGDIDTTTGTITMHDLASGLKYPHDVLYDGSGNVWMTAGPGCCGETRVTPYLIKYNIAGATATYFQIPGADIFPGAMDMDSLGRIWISDGAIAGSSTDNRIALFEPATLSFTEFEPPATGYETPNGITVDGNGKVWFTVFYGNRLGTLNLTSPRHYYFTWYDMTAGWSDWLLMANPSSASGTSVDYGSIARTTCLPNGYELIPGAIATPAFPSLMNGPVKVSSMDNDTQIISQRVLYNGSFEEVVSIPEAELSDHYYYTWYDMQTPGQQDYLLVSNPTAETVEVDVWIQGVHQGATYPSPTMTLAPGEKQTPLYPGVMGGPVEIKAHAVGDAGTPKKVITSQRVVWQGHFNEISGIPAGSLESENWFSWYDGVYSDGDWVLVCNPSITEDVDVQIALGPPAAPTLTYTAQLGHSSTDNMAFPQFRGSVTGPASVRAFVHGGSWSNPSDRRVVITSQRSLWSGSFEEVLGVPLGYLNSDYNWSWYDQQSAGSFNWVLLANPSTTETVVAEVWVAGVKMHEDNDAGKPDTFTLTPSAPILTPRFGYVMNGPVEVRAYVQGGNWSNPSDRRRVISTQRVLWQGNFNEAEGIVLP